LALLKKEMFSPELSERLRFILSNSIYALLHDFRLIADAGWDQVAELDLPMLFIHGENDKICTLASVKKLVGQLQQARVMTIEGMERLPVDQQRVSIMNALNATIDKWY
jgi:pimeloyl-ACP methyl ester carboxylesterase